MQARSQAAKALAYTPRAAPYSVPARAGSARMRSPARNYARVYAHGIAHARLGGGTGAHAHTVVGVAPSLSQTILYLDFSH